MLNQSLLNDSSIVNDDVDFPVSGLEPLREEEEEEEEGVDVEDDGTRIQTTSGFSYQPTEGLTTSVIPSMANLVEEDEKNDEEGDKDIVSEGRDGEGATTGLITEAVPSMSRLLDQDEDEDKENMNAAENRSGEANASTEQGVQEDEVTLGSVLNVTTNNNQSIASQYTSGGTEKLKSLNSVDDSMMQNNNNKQQPITPSFTFGFDSSLDPDLVDKDGSSREHATITPATVTTTPATRMNTTTGLNNTTTKNNTTTMNTGTMNLGYDDEDFNEIDLRANANKEMGTETYEFLYGAGANATRRLTEHSR